MSSSEFISSTAINSSTPLFNATLAPGGEDGGENFTMTVARFGLSVLIVGCVLLAVLSLVILGHRLSQQRRARKAMARRLEAGEGQYSNPGELLEDEDQVTAGQGGVLVIQTHDDNPKERLRTNKQRRPSDYEATASSMAKYVERKALPQATV